MKSLRIGLPSKGRLAEQATELLSQAGLSFRRQERSLFARVSEMPVELTFLRAEDIPVLCAEGAIDLGVTGSDLIAEAGVDVTPRLALGIGKCRLSVCLPDESRAHSPQELHGKRVATSFPRITERFFAANQAQVHLVPLSGSVEIMVALGVADAIVDLVETGSTLAANRLRVLTDIGQYETVLMQNQQRRYPDIADRVVRRLQGVVVARTYSLLEYNIPKSKLHEAEKITPGYNSPTISALEDPEWCAVQDMVKRKEVIDVMDKLEAMGAKAILETQIINCRL
jgi:ATP phosphoribosyltransferase